MNVLLKMILVWDKNRAVNEIYVNWYLKNKFLIALPAKVIIIHSNDYFSVVTQTSVTSKHI